MGPSDEPINVAIVAQKGRIAYQAVLSAASIRAHHPREQIRIFICVPKNSALWEQDPAIDDVEMLDAFKRYDCELVSFDNADFGSSYPISNKFYSILSLPPNERFLFLDSDTLLVAPMRPDSFNFSEPGLTDAMPNWPVARDGYTIAEIWESLYTLFGLDASAYFDPERGVNEHQCYPYYQGNVMFYERAGAFGREMLEMAKQLWREQPKPVQKQKLKPWLDQIVLPLVLAKLGAPRRKKSDSFRDVIVHYQYTIFLTVRNARAIECFGELTKDPRLVSVLNHDEGFRYFMSEEGRERTKRDFAEFLASPERGKKGAFKEFMRRRAQVLR